MKKVSNFANMLRIRLQREEIYTKQEYWDLKATEYDDKSISLWPNPNLNELYHSEQISLIDELTGPVAGKKLLDVGCGMGRMSRHFAGRGARVLGLDFSPATVEVARGLSSNTNPEYKVGSFFELSGFADYDSVFTSAALAMACKGRDDLLCVLRQLRGALKLGGVFLTVEPLHKGFLHRVLDMRLSEFIEALSSCGFDVVEVRQLHFWPMRLALAYIRWPNVVTAPAYHLGQMLMRFPGLNGLGDYKAIKAIAI